MLISVMINFTATLQLEQQVGHCSWGQVFQPVLATTAACKCEGGHVRVRRVQKGPQALNCCIPCGHKLENFCVNLGRG